MRRGERGHLYGDKLRVGSSWGRKRSELSLRLKGGTSAVLLKKVHEEGMR